MVAFSAMSPPRRKKPATYGKASRTSSWSLAALDDDDQTTPKTTLERSSMLNPSRPVKEHEVLAGVVKQVRTAGKERERDPWDIPSSDEEGETLITNRMPPLVSSTKRKPVNVTKEAEVGLAPWEKKQSVAASRHEEHARTLKSTFDTATSTAQSTVELAETVGGEETTRGRQLANPQTEQKASVTPSSKALGSKLSSAAARLQVRKDLTDNRVNPKMEENLQVPAPAQKRSVNDDTDPTPHKRQRSNKVTQHNSVEVHISDSIAPVTSERTLTTKTRRACMDTDVYDIFSSSDKESAPSKPKGLKVMATQKGPGRGRMTRLSPRKEESAPARLSKMISRSMNSNAEVACPASVTQQKPVSPRKYTPPSRASTPERAPEATETMTPRQKELWDQLLPNEMDVRSPSILPMEDLTLRSRRPAKTGKAPPRNLTKSSSDVGPRRRPRLVDRLKASVTNTDDELGKDSTDESDVEMTSESKQESETHEERYQSHQPQKQSQRQNSIASHAGPKVTYARTRSYLPEDTFEDNLMLDIPSDTPQRLGLQYRSGNGSQTSVPKSAFDLDDSDDEGTQGRLRTVHELRAGGTNQRFRDNIGSLLEDISDHNVSARGRRRSALVEIATQMADQTFAEKFTRQSYEHQLLAECNATPDAIADFALGSAFVMMMCSEQPQHLATSLRDHGLLRWLVRMLGVRTDAIKLAKERQNNMSKAAQSTFVAFVKTLAEHDVVWGEAKPGSITPRTVALKACDQLIGKLRRSGDRTELMSAIEIRELLPLEAEINEIANDRMPVDVVLAISSLESLSTASLSLAWPEDVVERLGLLLISPRLGDGKSQHLRFLTLRLCLNLTNENARNCKVFSTLPTVVFTMRAIAEGFDKLSSDVNDAQHTVNLDLLVLSMGILINLTEHNDDARQNAATVEAAPMLASLVDVFQRGQQRVLEAESEEQTVANVAYGYLAVVLANLCRNKKCKLLIATRLPEGKLIVLVDALAEFVLHHQRVDTMNFDGEEGAEVWSAFTEKLKAVLMRLSMDAEVEEKDQM